MSFRDGTGDDEDDSSSSEDDEEPLLPVTEDDARFFYCLLAICFLLSFTLAYYADLLGTGFFFSG